MKLPHIVQLQVDRDAAAAVLARGNGWRENIWRRHQYPDNAAESGWSSVGDRRRRLLHFRDQYAVDGNSFVLQHVYLRVVWCLPTEEAAKLRSRLLTAASEWSVTRTSRQFQAVFGDLTLTVGSQLESPYDMLCGNTTAEGYTNLDMRLCDRHYPLDDSLGMLPWWIFSHGPRQRQTDKRPQKLNLSDLSQFWPCHLELGCGPSIEAGVSPLHELHKVYSLKNSDGLFEFGETDSIVDAICSPQEFYRSAANIHLENIQATTTPFYESVLAGLKSGRILKPVFNNNFDGILESLTSDTFSLRSRDRYHHYGDYPLLKTAKSLLVVGAHADRRMLQKQFINDIGGPVVYVDPEGYQGGLTYPLECAYDNSYHLPITAGEFASALLS